jgi:putative transposase
MARPLRICVPGGVYHVIARGNERASIYRDDADRFAFLRVLARVVNRFGWRCHAYCLMSNHYHLVVETPRPNLPTGMQQLNGRYAQWFNERHDRCGHVFHARYRSILVQKDSHLLALCRYVVLNPVRAGLCRSPTSYHWSSYRATAGSTPAEPFLTTDSFLTTDWILGCFASSRAAAQARYRAFVAEHDREPMSDQVLGERLGGPAILEETFGLEPPMAEIPRVQVEPLPPTVAEIFAAEPDAPVLTAYRRHGYTLRAIAEHLGCHYSTVSRRLRREEANA